MCYIVSVTATDIGEKMTKQIVKWNRVFYREDGTVDTNASGLTADFCYLCYTKCGFIYRVYLDYTEEWDDKSTIYTHWAEIPDYNTPNDCEEDDAYTRRSG